MIDLPAAPGSTDIDALIHRAELTVIEGDQQFRWHADQAKQLAARDAKRAASIGSATVAGVGVVIAGWIVFRIWRKKSRQLNTRRLDTGRDAKREVERSATRLLDKLPLPRKPLLRLPKLPALPDLTQRFRSGRKRSTLRYLMDHASTLAWWWRLLRKNMK